MKSLKVSKSEDYDGGVGDGNLDGGGAIGGVSYSCTQVLKKETLIRCSLDVTDIIVSPSSPLSTRTDNPNI